MMDTGVIQANVQTKDSFGEPVNTWPVDSADVACGLNLRSGNERHALDKTILKYDATIRLPIASTPDPKDRIKVTKRFSETLLTPLVFDIVGPIQRGPSGIRLLLKRATT